MQINFRLQKSPLLLCVKDDDESEKGELKKLSEAHETDVFNCYLRDDMMRMSMADEMIRGESFHSIKTEKGRKSFLNST